VPRHHFVLPEYLAAAYEDHALPINWYTTSWYYSTVVERANHCFNWWNSNIGFWNNALLESPTVKIIGIISPLQGKY